MRVHAQKIFFFFTDLVCNQKSLETMIWSIKFPSKDNFQSLAQCQELCLGIFFYFFFIFKIQSFITLLFKG